MKKGLFFFLLLSYSGCSYGMLTRTLVSSGAKRTGFSSLLQYVGYHTCPQGKEESLRAELEYWQDKKKFNDRLAAGARTIFLGNLIAFPFSVVSFFKGDPTSLQILNMLSSPVTTPALWKFLGERVDDHRQLEREAFWARLKLDTASYGPVTANVSDDVTVKEKLALTLAAVGK